jgi:hypothetical protein
MDGPGALQVSRTDAVSSADQNERNLVLTEPRPIGPLIPFRAGLAILVLA